MTSKCHQPPKSKCRQRLAWAGLTAVMLVSPMLNKRSSAERPELSKSKATCQRKLQHENKSAVQLLAQYVQVVLVLYGALDEFVHVGMFAQQ